MPVRQQNVTGLLGSRHSVLAAGNDNAQLDARMSVRAMEAGCDFFIEKPIEAHKLLELVVNLTAEQQAKN